jgi:hypothetical protein
MADKIYLVGTKIDGNDLPDTIQIEEGKDFIEIVAYSFVSSNAPNPTNKQIFFHADSSLSLMIANANSSKSSYSDDEADESLKYFEYPVSYDEYSSFFDLPKSPKSAPNVACDMTIRSACRRKKRIYVGYLKIECLEVDDTLSGFDKKVHKTWTKIKGFAGFGLYGRRSRSGNRKGKFYLALLAAGEELADLTVNNKC